MRCEIFPGAVAAFVGFLALTGCGDDGGGGDDEGTSTGSTGGPTTQGPTTATESTTGVETSTGVDASSSEGSSSTGPMGECGNGMTEAGEACDDGNLDGDDGCSEDCSTATCLVPVSHATVQAAEDDTECPTVWIMPGTYTANVVVDRDVVFEQVPLGDVILDGGAAGSTVRITAGDVTLRGLIVQNGQAARGGGIYAESPLTLEATTVQTNTATQEGGGIYTRSDLTLDASAVVSNTLTDDPPREPYEGAGINATEGTVLITNGSAVSENAIVGTMVDGTVARGGGLFVQDGELTIEGGSEVDGNTITLSGPGNQEGGSAGLHLSSVGAVLDDASITNNVVTVTSTDASSIGADGGGILMRSSQLTMSGSDLSGNRAEADSAGSALAQGGAIFIGSGADSTVSVTSSAIDDNAVHSHSGGMVPTSAQAYGGVLHARAVGSGAMVIQLDASTITNNTATAVAEDMASGIARAGAFHVEGWIANGVQLDIVGCSVTGNAAEGTDRAAGGAIYASSSFDNGTVDVTFEASTIAANSATATIEWAWGGAAFIGSSGSGSATIVRSINSTWSDNAVDATEALGGAVHLWTNPGVGAPLSRLDLASSTLTLNDAGGGSGGAIYAIDPDLALIPLVTFTNTILFGNMAVTGPDCATVNGAALFSGGYNLMGVAASCQLSGSSEGNLFDTDPMLGALGDNGGPTETHALPMGSAAVDAGNPAGCTDPDGGALASDQRGEDRHSGGRCDMGAYEFQHP